MLKPIVLIAISVVNILVRRRIAGLVIKMITTGQPIPITLPQAIRKIARFVIRRQIGRNPHSIIT